MTKLANLSLFLLVLSAFSPPASADDYVTNPQFDLAKPPILDEAKPETPGIDKRWARASQEPKCEGDKVVWALVRKGGNASKLEVNAFKDKAVAVKGWFNTFVASASPDKGALRGKGAVNMASWDSDLAARDYRVMKYVFGVESPKHQVLEFDFEISPWVMDQPHANPKLEARFKFRGKAAKLSWPVKVEAVGRGVRVTSTKQARFEFLTQEAKAQFLKLMELCNHERLGSFAEPSIDLRFEPVCPAR